MDKHFDAIPGAGWLLRLFRDRRQFRDRPELMVAAVLYLFPESFAALAAEPGVQFGVNAYIGPEPVTPPLDRPPFPTAG